MGIPSVEARERVLGVMLHGQIRVTQETHIFVYLWWSFQGHTGGEKTGLNMSSTVPWVGSLD